MSLCDCRQGRDPCTCKPVSALDRVTAERDAALRRESEALKELEDVSGTLQFNTTCWGRERTVMMDKAEALQQRLTAADEQLDDCGQFQQRQIAVIQERNARVDLLESALRKIKVRLDAYAESDMRMPEPSVEVCQAIADAALKQSEAPLNQCDGCQAGIPVVNGAHRMGKPGGYADTMSCTAKLYVEERPNECCCPPKGHTGLWAAAMCPVHQGLRALKR